MLTWLLDGGRAYLLVVGVVPQNLVKKLLLPGPVVHRRLRGDLVGTVVAVVPGEREAQVTPGLSPGYEVIKPTITYLGRTEPRPTTPWRSRVQNWAFIRN